MITGFSAPPSIISDLPGGFNETDIRKKVNELVRNQNTSNVINVEVSSATTGYSGFCFIANHASTRVVVSLPTIAKRGDTFSIVGKGAAGWKISQATGQIIHGSSNTTSGASGYLQSGSQYNCVTLKCVTDNTDFVVTSHEGTLTFA